MSMSPEHMGEEAWTLEIDADGGSFGYWRDLWIFRELFFFLSWRDVLIRYKQTAVGVAWCLIRPLLTMVVFTVIFGKIAKLPSEGTVPYPIMVFVAMLPWQLFATATVESSNALIGNAQMISKVYFPRLLLPMSKVAVALFDFFVAFVILLLLCLGYGVSLGPRLLVLPALLALATLVAFGVGIFFAALNVRFRDFKYVVPFLVQLGLYVSPVGFSSSIVPGNWRWLYSLNPMVGVIDGFRWAVLSTKVPIYLPGLALSVVASIALFVGGIAYFRATERTFADVI